MKITEFDRPKRTRRQGPLLRARRRETPGARRGGLNQWGPRELGARFHASRDPGARGTTEGRILVVDDEAAIRLICRLNLRSAGFDTLEASDGASAIALARAERPDLILLDVMLPDLDGFQVAQRLRSSGFPVPVLFLTARDSVEDRISGLTVGGDDYVTKPFEPLEMTNTVRDVLVRVRRGERDAMRGEWERLISGS